MVATRRRRLVVKCETLKGGMSLMAKAERQVDHDHSRTYGGNQTDAQKRAAEWDKRIAKEGKK